MPKFSNSSLDKLETCDIRLIRLFKKVVLTYDCTIVEGHRNAQRQDRAYRENKSQVKYPESKHNSYPSKAVDVAPYRRTKPHIGWDNTKSFHVFAGYVYRVAEEMGIRVRWGGNWNGGDIEKQDFEDIVHWEIVD